MAAALKTNSDLLDKNQQHILKIEKQLLARLDESGVVTGTTAEKVSCPVY